jgi:hypothetical protein
MVCVLHPSKLRLNYLLTASIQAWRAACAMKTAALSGRVSACHDDIFSRTSDSAARIWAPSERMTGLNSATEARSFTESSSHDH